VIESYGLDKNMCYLRTAGGNRGENIIIQTATGKKLLKRYKKTLGEETIVQEHSILKQLEKINFPAPRVVPMETGQTLVKHKGGRFALFEYIEDGYQFNNYILLPFQENKFIKFSGEILGVLHKSLIDFSPKGYNPDGFKSMSEDRWRNIDWYLEKLSFCEKELINLNLKNLSNYILKKINMIVTCRRDFINMENYLLNIDLPRIIIHGDYGPYNLLFKKSGAVFVLDFEMARLEWRLVEIIKSIHRFCLKRYRFSLKKMNIFVKSYNSIVEITNEEIELIPDLWIYVKMKDAIRSLFNFCRNKEDKYLHSFLASMKSIDWIKRNEEKVKCALK
jgi:Ser/Thr protein kinase RdoA (MazF antagonist)